MQYNLMRKSFIAVVLVLSVIFTSVFSVGFVSAANSSSSSLNDKKDEIKDKLNDLDDQLDEVKGDKADAKQEAERLETQLNEIKSNMEKITVQIDAIDAEIKPIQDDINRIDAEIKQIDTDIAKQQADIDQKEIEFNKLFDLLKQRLRALYIAGDASALEVLLTSSDVSDFLNRFELVKGVAEHDSNLMKQVQELVEQIKALQASLESQKATQLQLKDEAVAKKAVLDEKKAEAQNRKDELTADQTKYNDLIAKSNELIKELNTKENDIISEYIENENALDAIDEQIKNIINSSGSSSDITTGGSAGNVSNGSGSKINMIWPVQGCSTYISSGYGPRWGKIHRGIDITGGGIHGKNVVAAASGKVILALNTTTGYGKYVIVDHGNGIATLYAHCSQLKVSVGDYVTQGQTIALVGSTGNSTGPHLHFEVRINGERVNPMNYINK